MGTAAGLSQLLCPGQDNVVTIQWRRKVPKMVGGGGGHRHVIYVPSVKNQYKRVVFGCMVI